MIIRLLKWLSFAALLLVFSVVGYVLFIQLSFDSTKPIVNYGSVDTELFTDESQTRPLLVYFGGSEGGKNKNSLSLEPPTPETVNIVHGALLLILLAGFTSVVLPKVLVTRRLEVSHQVPIACSRGIRYQSSP